VDWLWGSAVLVISCILAPANLVQAGAWYGGALFSFCVLIVISCVQLSEMEFIRFSCESEIFFIFSYDKQDAVAALITPKSIEQAYTFWSYHGSNEGCCVPDI